MIEALILIAGAALNGAVVFGVMRTELKYLRRDIDRAHRRLDSITEGRKVQHGV
jgi:hypothetical protein